MKINVFMAVLLIPVCAHAEKVELWTYGVTRETGGWSDFNKVNPRIEDGDNNLCWAASAANIIDWWQKQYQIPEGTPTGNEIWTTFKDSFTDLGSSPYYAFEWWLDGTYRPAGKADWAQEKTPGVAGGYYKDLLEPSPYSYWGYTTNATDYMAFESSFDSVNSYQSLSSSIRDLLLGGAGLTLSIADTNGTTAHAITLWGIEYDTESNLITKMYLTDSDDDQYGYVSEEDGLFEVACFPVTIETVVGSQGTITETLLGFKTVDGNSWYDRAGNTFYVTEVSGLLPANFLTAIPEPSVFGLLAGLGALVLAGTRRSRESFKR